jgi:hypothetical protein
MTQMASDISDKIGQRSRARPKFVIQNDENVENGIAVEIAIAADVETNEASARKLIANGPLDDVLDLFLDLCHGFAYSDYMKLYQTMAEM